MLNGRFAQKSSAVLMVPSRNLHPLCKVSTFPPSAHLQIPVLSTQAGSKMPQSQFTATKRTPECDISNTLFVTDGSNGLPTTCQRKCRHLDGLRDDLSSSGQQRLQADVLLPLASLSAAAAAVMRKAGTTMTTIAPGTTAAKRRAEAAAATTSPPWLLRDGRMGAWGLLAAVPTPRPLHRAVASESESTTFSKTGRITTACSRRERGTGMRRRRISPRILRNSVSGRCCLSLLPSTIISPTFFTLEREGVEDWPKKRRVLYALKEMI